MNRDGRAADDRYGVGGAPSVGVNSCARKKCFSAQFLVGDYTGVCTRTTQNGSIQRGRPGERFPHHLPPLFVHLLMITDLSCQLVPVQSLL
jgi:hypothetical protein